MARKMSPLEPKPDTDLSWLPNGGAGLNRQTFTVAFIISRESKSGMPQTGYSGAVVLTSTENESQAEAIGRLLSTSLWSGYVIYVTPAGRANPVYFFFNGVRTII